MSEATITGISPSKDGVSVTIQHEDGNTENLTLEVNATPDEVKEAVKARLNQKQEQQTAELNALVGQKVDTVVVEEPAEEPEAEVTNGEQPL